MNVKVMNDINEKNITGCDGHPLGMEHGHIPDSALAASSTFDMHSVGPHIARARKVTE